MSKSGKSLFSLFMLLALIALGHDVYLWYVSDGFPFNFAALGWITKTYLSSEHQLVVETLGPDTFNAILTPILKIPAVFITGGIAALIAVIDFINSKIKNIKTGRRKNYIQNQKRYK